MSAHERTGWRDGEISSRHRQWGFNCPAVDLDFVMMEYNHGKPCALVEYKHKSAAEVNPRDATYRALIDLADNYSGEKGPLCCFVARYDPDDWSFVVEPLNEKAKRLYANKAGKRLTEREFVETLHLLRKRTLTASDKEAILKLTGTREADKDSWLSDYEKHEARASQ